MLTSWFASLSSNVSVTLQRAAYHMLSPITGVPGAGNVAALAGTLASPSAKPVKPVASAATAAAQLSLMFISLPRERLSIITGSGRRAPVRQGADLGHRALGP